jgi:hypothetical protein
MNDTDTHLIRWLNDPTLSTHEAERLAGLPCQPLTVRATPKDAAAESAQNARSAGSDGCRPGYRRPAHARSTAASASPAART